MSLAFQFEVRNVSLYSENVAEAEKVAAENA